MVTSLTAKLIAHADRFQILAGMYTFYFFCFGGGGEGHFYGAPPPGACSNGVSGSNMDAVFEVVVHEESEIWTCLLHGLATEGLLQLPG